MLHRSGYPDQTAPGQSEVGFQLSSGQCVSG